MEIQKSKILNSNIQPKLHINTIGDKYEQEADAMADRVMRMPSNEPAKPVTGLIGKSLQRKCNHCEEEEKKKKTIMRKTEVGNSDMPVSSSFSSSLNASKGGGSSLPLATRSFMENAFSADFSGVKIHTGSEASKMSKGINAKAFTTGNDIYFNQEQYNPYSSEGKRLLAHELTHTMQQGNTDGASTKIRRGSEEAAVKRTDLIVVGEGWDGSDQLSKVLKTKGAQIINVTSTDELATALKAINFPVGTIYFITHSTSSGAMKFGSAEGFVTAADLTTKLNAVFSIANAPERLDFRGCNIGKDPLAMNSVGNALGAKNVMAGNCYAVIAHSTPIKIGDKKITKASQITESNLELFEDLMKRTADKYGEREKCILNPTKKGFFAAGGEFVLLWFNPTYTGDWLPGVSICFIDTQVQLVDGNKSLPETAGCQITKVEINAATEIEEVDSKEPEH